MLLRVDPPLKHKLSFSVLFNEFMFFYYNLLGNQVILKYDHVLLRGRPIRKVAGGGSTSCKRRIKYIDRRHDRK